MPCGRAPAATVRPATKSRRPVVQEYFTATLMTVSSPCPRRRCARGGRSRGGNDVEDAVVGEELLPRVAPVLGDRGDREGRDVGQPVGMAGKDFRLDGSVAVLGEQVLCGGGEQGLEICL